MVFPEKCTHKYSSVHIGFPWEEAVSVAQMLRIWFLLLLNLTFAPSQQLLGFAGLRMGNVATHSITQTRHTLAHDMLLPFVQRKSDFPTSNSIWFSLFSKDIIVFLSSLMVFLKMLTMSGWDDNNNAIKFMFARVLTYLHLAFNFYSRSLLDGKMRAMRHRWHSNRTRGCYTDIRGWGGIIRRTQIHFIMLIRDDFPCKSGWKKNREFERNSQFNI